MLHPNASKSDSSKSRSYSSLIYPILVLSAPIDSHTGTGASFVYVRVIDS